MTLALTLCVALSTAVFGRDSVRATPVRTTVFSRDGTATVATVPTGPVLALPASVRNVTLFTFPDRLANEAPPNLQWVPVSVRATRGLSVPPSTRVPAAWVTWTENGIVYLLTSDERDVDDLLHVADTLRPEP